MRKILLLLLICLSCASVKAQDDPEYRMEIGAGAGVVNYLGDYNGSLVGDLQPMGSVVGRYIFNPTTALKLKLGVGKLKGTSKDVDTYYPDLDGDVMTKDDYNFNSTLVDFGVTFEYNLWPYGTGRDYRGAKRLTPYIYIGLGTTYAKCDANDKSTFSVNLPVGLGLKYKLTDRVNLGVDYALHFTQSDELDGMKDPYGIQSSGLFKNTDCYSVLGVSITYSFSAKCRTCNKDDW